MNMTGNVVSSYTFPDGHFNEQAVAFHPDQPLCAFVTSLPDDETNQCLLNMMNYQTGDIIYTAETILSDCDKCIFYNNQVIVIGSDNKVSPDNPLEYILELQIQAFPTDKGTAKWEIIKEGSSFEF